MDEDKLAEFASDIMTRTPKMVTVKCPNHTRELTNRLWNLLQTRHGLDYELKCGERSVRAHGVMLQAFLSTADSAHLTSVQDSEPPPGDDILQSVLEFLYKGTVTLSQELLDDLYDTARQLNFRLLVDAVEETKRCMADETIIPVVGSVPSETCSEILVLNKTLPSQVSGEQSTKKVKLSRPVVAVRARVNQSDISDSSSWQPDSPEAEFDMDSGSSSCRTSQTFLATMTVPEVLSSTEVLTMAQKCYSFESTSVGQLALHQAVKHDSSILIYRCSKCKTKFGTEAEMQDHCQHCDVGTGSRNRNSSNPGIYRCSLCTYETGSRSEIRQHQNCVHHIDNKGKPISELRCSECDFTTWVKIYFNRHMRQEHPNLECGPFKCTICEFETSSHISISKHQKRVHRIDTEGNPIAEMKCSDCDYSTWLKGCFRRHRRQKHPGPEHVGQINRCSLCRRVFLSADDLLKHMTNHKTYKCNMCDFESQLQIELSRHRVAAHSVYASGEPMPTISCSECGLKTSCMARLKTHMVAKHSGPQIIKCKFCSRKFRSAESLAEHIIDHPKYSCDLCKFETKYYNGLITHKNGVHHLDSKGKPIDKMTCPDCMYSTMNSVCFSRHRRLKHTDLGDADWMISCSLCERIFKSMDMLNEHMANHKTFKCSLCDFEGKKLHQLTVHRIAIHSVFASGKPRPTFDCTECDFKSPFRSGLEAHKLARHFPSKAKPFQVKLVISDTGEKSYVCEVCEAIFSRKSDLKKHHQVNHAEEHRPHLCHQCGGAFKTRTHLNKHMRTVHKTANAELTNTDASMVVECDYETSFQTGLDDHKLAEDFLSKAKPFQLKEVISDTGEKSYVCEVCEAIFSRKVDVKKHHQVNHAGEHRPHLCHQCGGAFKLRKHLNKHIRNVHKKVNAGATKTDKSKVVVNE